MVRESIGGGHSFSETAVSPIPPFHAAPRCRYCPSRGVRRHDDACCANGHCERRGRPERDPARRRAYVGTSPRGGYSDSCQTSFTGGGAYVAGPWIDTANRTWDEATKIAVSGAVSWS